MKTAPELLRELLPSDVAEEAIALAAQINPMFLALASTDGGKSDPARAALLAWWAGMLYGQAVHRGLSPEIAAALARHASDGRFAYEAGELS